MARRTQDGSSGPVGTLTRLDTTAAVSDGGEQDALYPPEPWRLGAQMLLSVFRVPCQDLPRGVDSVTPQGVRGLVVGSRATVGVAFAHYDDTGVLTYDELLVALAGLRGWRPVATISRIWVDSPAARDGGRDLWGIPKELGSFERRPSATEVGVALDDDGRRVAALDARLGRLLAPGLRRLPLTTSQRRDGTDITSTNLLLARVRRLRPTWTFDPDGPLGWLHGRTPALSVALTDATLVVGTAVARTPA